MTDTSSLSHLIERLERATGRDEQLDYEILCIKDPRAIRSGPLRGDPKYTSSIDAAMTLAPKGWCCGFENGGRFDCNPNSEAWCWPFNSDFEPDWQNGDEGYRSAPDGYRGVGTPAVAMCIAALKAQLSTRTNEQDDARNLSGVSSE